MTAPEVVTKERIIQEFVPGKQVTLAHSIANPTVELCKKIGVPGAEAIGIMTLTPGETAMIAGDIATKAASVEIGFLDRFSGALVICGSVASVDESVVLSGPDGSTLVLIRNGPAVSLLVPVFGGMDDNRVLVEHVATKLAAVVANES